VDREAAPPLLCVDCRGPDAGGPASSFAGRIRVRLYRLIAWRRA